MVMSPMAVAPMIVVLAKILTIVASTRTSMTASIGEKNLASVDRLRLVGLPRDISDVLLTARNNIDTPGI